MPSWVWIENVVFPLVGMGMAVLCMFGAYRIITRWIERRHERLMATAPNGASTALLEQVQSRLEALEDNAIRLQELEERLDFAERMLTREREHRRLEG